MVEDTPAPERTQLLAGWGLTAPSAAQVQTPITRREVEQSFAGKTPRGVLARGLGRSYGDAALNAGGRVIDDTMLDAIDLDPVTGICTADAGASIDTLIKVLVPRGYFVPVTPGTRYVTVGGAIAADIHGKNHHKSGSWMDHVLSFRLLVPSGEVIDVTPETHHDLFWATAGGLGLTGVVLDATFRCPPVETSRLVVDTIRARDLDEIMDLMRHDQSTYSVAWVDMMAKGSALGRSVLTTGRFATLDELPRGERHDPYAYRGEIAIAAPPLIPGGLLTASTTRAMCEVWFRKAPKRRDAELQTIPTFFHPLDMIGHWNRVYGPPGFVQWQFALPFGTEPTVRRIVEQLSSHRCPIFVSVLKTFGPANPGPLSFPIGGWTLAVDIPSDAAGLPELLDELDVLVAEAGGRIYLAKDSRLRAELLPVMYPRLDEWRAVRDAVDPGGMIQSDLARRLGL